MTKLEEFKKNINGANVNVIGIGISNMPLIRLLVKLGAKAVSYTHLIEWEQEVAPRMGRVS